MLARQSAVGIFHKMRREFDSTHLKILHKSSILDCYIILGSVFSILQTVQNNFYGQCSTTRRTIKRVRATATPIMMIHMECAPLLAVMGYLPTITICAATSAFGVLKLVVGGSRVTTDAKNFTLGTC